MTYYQFVQAVEGKVKEGVKENVVVSVRSATKNNGKERQGLLLSEHGINISPTIYLEEYYQRYQKGNTVEEIAGDILRLYGEVKFNHPYESTYIKVFTKVNDKIIYHLINREKNKKMLEDVPFIPYMDLAIVFYVLLETNTYGTATMLIKNEHIKVWGVNKEELYRQAAENTERLLPYEFMTMRAVMEELTKESSKSVEDDMYVLSNHIRSYGAAAILYNSRLKAIGEYLKQNYYVLPSSVHEVIIIPESQAPGRWLLSKMVEEINHTQVDEEEVLADHAYYYDRTIEKLL